MNALDPVPHRLFLTKQDENIYPYITYRSLFAVQRSSKYRQPYKYMYKFWIEDKCILSGYAQHLVGSKLSLALDTFLKIPYDTRDVQRKLFKKDRIQNLDRLGGVGRHKRGRYGIGHIGLVFLVVGGGYPRICFEYVLKLTTKWCILRHSIGIISTSTLWCNRLIIFVQNDILFN